MSNSLSQESDAAECQFLTVHYNPAAHPKQIALLDTNGQQILYTLIPSHQNIPVQVPSQVQSNNVSVMSNANVCCVCGSDAVAKCSYGISRGTPCGRLLCLSHICELPGMNGGRYPHCPAHFQHIQQNKCHIL